MAKATIKREVTINLRLTESETRWLTAYLQNWLGVDKETQEHAEMRCALHQELHNALADISQSFR